MNTLRTHWTSGICIAVAIGVGLCMRDLVHAQAVGKGGITSAPSPNQGIGPNTNPNAPVGTANGPNQNPFAPFSGPVGQAVPQTGLAPLTGTGSTIPLGTVTGVGSGGLTTGFGMGSNLPFFLSFPFGYGFSNGFYPWTYYNPRYYGAGVGYGDSNLVGSGLDLPATTVGGRIVERIPTNAAEQRELINNARMLNELYYEFKERNRAYRLLQIAREHSSPEVIAKVQLSNVPRWLGPDELNRETGAIAWPLALRGEEFARLRTQIEEAFRGRLTSSASNEADTEELVREDVNVMIGLLRTHIEEMPADEYMLARKFLDSVAYAAHKLIAK
jgi:hypothetical protein